MKKINFAEIVTVILFLLSLTMLIVFFIYENNAKTIVSNTGQTTVSPIRSIEQETKQISIVAAETLADEINTQSTTELVSETTETTTKLETTVRQDELSQTTMEKVVTVETTKLSTTIATSKGTSVHHRNFVSLQEFLKLGVVYFNNYKFTYYSQSKLPGHNLKIPGRHVNKDGYVSDGDGYIVLANNAPIGTIVETPFGYKGKVYDRGFFADNQYDVYIR